MRQVKENWSVGECVMENQMRELNLKNRHPIRPPLHYSITPLPTYSAKAARQSRIGGKPSCSESKQRNGV